MSQNHDHADNQKVKVVVLGAGVIGLTTAMLLSKDPRYSVTVIAKHMPGDYDIEYASPWAGANYLPYVASGWSALEPNPNPASSYERETWAPLENLAANHPEAGIHFQDTTLYTLPEHLASPQSFHRHFQNPSLWFATTLPNLTHIESPSSSLPAPFAASTSFTSVCINTALYLPYLASQSLARGVTLARGIVTHVASAATLHSSGTRAHVVVNCTGLGARTLGGVDDQAVIPARGQIVVVRNDPGVMLATSGLAQTKPKPNPADKPDEDDSHPLTNPAPSEVTYIMHRAAGGGCVLGGSYQLNNWDPHVDQALAQRIMRRAVALCPRLVTGGTGFMAGEADGSTASSQQPQLQTDQSKDAGEEDGEVDISKLSIIRHGVGLRPTRQPGPRVEREWFPLKEPGVGYRDGHASNGVGEPKGVVVSGPEAGDVVVGADVGGDEASVAPTQAGSAERGLGGEGERKEAKNEMVKQTKDGVWVVHQYGHGGAGYQSSYGSAAAALKLVEEAVRELGL